MNPAQVKPPLSEPVSRAVSFFEALSPDTLHRLVSLYDEQATFSDPFNEVTGSVQIGEVFGDMFVQFSEPTFRVVSAFESSPHAFLSWDLTFRFRRYGSANTHCIHGASHLTFGADGRIVRHRDYWDAAHQLYERLPIIGPLMRRLRKRAATHG